MDYFEHPDSEWGSTNLGWGAGYHYRCCCSQLCCAGLPRPPPPPAHESDAAALPPCPHPALPGPAGWYDNRTNKRSPKAPDFKKKEGGREGE